jgi:hypothetical protein
MPYARVVASSSLDEARDIARELSSKPPGLLVVAGGDGTAVGLLNGIRGDEREGAWLPNRPGANDPTLGLLRLGTGNGWASVMGAPRWRTAVTRIGRLVEGAGAMPVKRFDLVEVDSSLAHFAGTGWDAEIIDDFHAQQSGFGILPKRARAGLPGYLYGLVTRTIPRGITHGPPDVELVNTGEDAMTVDDDGKAVPLPGGEHGKVLYRGPVSVCAAGTAPEWGFGFRAFPFAGLVPRRFCMRVYAGRAIEATSVSWRLWRGEHPLPKMHTWMLTRCHATFSREVPFQIGGDRFGRRQSVEYKLAEEQVDVLDWRALDAAA